jgi:hypothetical protein
MTDARRAPPGQALSRRGRADQERRAAARYERGQVEHRHREQGLAQLNDAALVERERLADEKLKQAEDLMVSYDAQIHQAAISLNQINERHRCPDSFLS